MSDPWRSRRAGARPAPGPGAVSSRRALSNEGEHRLVLALFAAGFFVPVPAYVSGAGAFGRFILEYATCDLETARERALGAAWTRHPRGR